MPGLHKLKQSSSNDIMTTDNGCVSSMESSSLDKKKRLKNHVAYYPSPNELERLVREEKEKRRRMRIVQVRVEKPLCLLSVAKIMCI